MSAVVFTARFERIKLIPYLPNVWCQPLKRCAVLIQCWKHSNGALSNPTLGMAGTRYERVYRAHTIENPTTYHKGQLAEAELALPGWRLAVDVIFS